MQSMAPVDKPQKPPSVFKNTHQEYYWQLKRLFPNFQQTSVPPSTRIKSSSSTDSKHQSVKDTRRGTPPANCSSRGIPPANGTFRGTPLVNDISRGTPSVNGTVRGNPPANGTSRATSLVDEISRGTLSGNGTGRGTPPANGTSRGIPPVNDINRTPSVNDTGRGTPPANGTNKGTPPVNNINRTPSVNDTGRGTPPANRTSRDTPPANSTRRGALSMNGTNRGTLSAYSTSREVSSGNDTNKGTPSLYGTSREVSSVSGTNKGTPPSNNTCGNISSTSSSRGTKLSSGGTAAPRTFPTTSCVLLAAGSTLRDILITSSLAPSSTRITPPQAAAPNNAPFNFSTPKATTSNLGMHSSSKPRVGSLFCPAAVTGSCQNTNPSMMGLIHHDVMKDSHAAIGDVPKPKRRRIKRKRISSTVVVQKKEKVREAIRSPQDAPKSLDCSIREIVMPEVTALPAPAVARLSGPTDNTKKKKGWQKLKEKRKAKLLDRQKTDPRLPCSLVRESQGDCVGPYTGLDAENDQQTTNTGARGSSPVGECMSLANADACLPTKKVTFALGDAGVSNPAVSQKTGCQFGSPCDAKHISGRTSLIRISGLAFTKNQMTSITPKALSNSTILLDCSFNEELSPKSVVTKKSKKVSLTSRLSPPSSTKQQVVSIPRTKPPRNYTTKPRSSLNTLSQTGLYQGVHSGLHTNNKPLTSSENGSPKEPHNLTYPSVVECSSDSPTSSSEEESFYPLATSSQIIRVPSLKRKVETTYFVAPKKVKLSCPGKTLGLDVCYLTSLTESCALPVPVHPKKVHFSTEDPGLSVSQAPSSSVENFSASSGSSSSGPSVISGTPSPVDTARKKVSFVPRPSRSGSEILMAKCSGKPTTLLKQTHKGRILNDLIVLETHTSLGKNRISGAKTHDTVIVDLEPRSNHTTRAESRTSTVCDESVIVLSPKAKSTRGHNKTNLTATRACSKKGAIIHEDVNNNSDESCEVTCDKVSTESNEEEDSFGTVDMLRSEKLGRTMGCQDSTSQDVTMSEESTCLEQSVFVVPHERRKLDKPKSRRGSRRIEFLENSIDLAL